MGLLDDTKKKRRNTRSSNPLANLEMLKDKLDITSLRIKGATHVKVLALRQVKLQNTEELLNEALDKVIAELDADQRAMYEKYERIHTDQKVDVLKQKGRL